MNEELADRYAEALRETIGWEGRMISFSKSGYHEAHPDRVAIFNANVCVKEGKIWHGDLDLTVDEERLAALAARIGETLYILYERDGRFENADAPLLAEAVYSVTPSAHTRYQHQYIERAADGTLRRRPLPRPLRWRWRVLLHRPRLLRFWRIENKTWTGSATVRARGRLVYIGRRDNGRTPLLVLGASRSDRLRSLGIELTWYPTDGLERSAGRALIRIAPQLVVGRLHLWCNLIVWPGRNYAFQAAYQDRRRGR